MKTTFRFIITAMAAIAVFSSCQKELANDTANKTTDGVRTISVQFDNSTKATLDGFTPKFEENDAIRVSNNTTSEVCTLSVTGTFTTTLSGELTAIYPADAADFTPGTPGTPDGKITGFKVSTSQNGKLKDAIIAKATIAENSSVATFQGQTAVFRITPGAGNSTKYVEVITAGPEIANTTTTEYTKKNKIHVATNDDDEVFVSVLVPAGGLKLRDLSFADGSNMKTVNDATNGGKAIEANTIYTITSSSWDRAYVEINGLKWATMNVGATSATEAGKYFMWGETTGITPSESSFLFPDLKYYSADNTSWNFTKGFAWENCPHTNGLYVGSGESKKLNVFTKYTTNSNYAYSGTADGLSILESADDAATANWGGSWRMPTGGTNAGDFIDLFNACGIASGFQEELIGGTGTKNKGVYWCNDYYDDGSGVKGALFIAEDNGTHLFFPAAGFGEKENLYKSGINCFFWSRTISSNTNSYILFITNENKFGVSVGAKEKYFGYSVRPVSD